MRLGRILLFAPVLASAAAAQTPALDEREFSSVWLIQPADEPLGARSVKDGDFVFKHKLLPPSLIRLKTDVIDEETGKTLVAAGAQLFGVLSAGPPIFCQIGIKDASLARSGAEFTVTGRKDKVIEIDVRRAIPPQPFGVVKTVTYTYY